MHSFTNIYVDADSAETTLIGLDFNIPSMLTKGKIGDELSLARLTASAILSMLGHVESKKVIDVVRVTGGVMILYSTPKGN